MYHRSSRGSSELKPTYGSDISELIKNLSRVGKHLAPKAANGKSALSHRMSSSSTTVEPGGQFITRLGLSKLLTQWCGSEAVGEYVDFVFAGDETVEVTELAARLVPPQAVIPLGEGGSVQVFM